MKAVIFDLGHTLIDYCNDWRVPERRAILEFHRAVSNGVEKPPREEEFTRVLMEGLEQARRRRRREMIEIPLVSFLEDRLRVLDVDSKEDLIEEGLGIFYQALLEHRTLIPGAVEILRNLEESGYLIGLISDVAWGLPSRFPLMDLGHYGLDAFFDDMVFSTDVGLRKPNPMIFRIALENLGARNEESVYVGNNLQTDIAGALGAGMKAVLKNSDYFFPDDRIVPSAKIADWSEFESVLESL